LKGDYWTQRQVDLLSRAWLNMKKGISKTWVLPAINVPKDGEMEVLNLNELKGTDVRYKDHMNMVAGVFCALWGFPSARLGYHPSGHTKDAEVNPDESTAIQGDDDPGLAPLLITLERVVNYLIWSRWPDLVFTFTGKNPKEDAREYEARSQARTMKERRAEADLQSLEDVLSKDATPAEIILARLMDQCPVDANQTGTYTTLASIVIKYILGIENGSEGDEKDKGAKTGEKKDPAKSESHGHMSGVRRDSAAEKGKAAA